MSAVGTKADLLWRCKRFKMLGKFGGRTRTRTLDPLILAASPVSNLGSNTAFIGGPGSAAGGVASMIERTDTGRALTAPRTRSFAVRLPLRKKAVAERRTQRRRCRQLT
jgi:hypothetical protein